MIPGLISLFQKRFGSAGGLSVTADPSYFMVSTPNPQQTGTCTATALGGVGPYTYLWSQLTGDGGITIDSPTSNSTMFEAVTGPSDSISGTFACTVTDSASTTAGSNVVTVQFQTPS